jgi:hypothetical protein
VAFLLALASPRMGAAESACGAEPLEVPVQVLVAQCGTPAEAVQPHGWAEDLVRGANELLTPHGITLRARVGTFTPARCDVATRRGRDALAPFVRADGEVTVTVVRHLWDLARRSYDLMGVQVRYGGRDPELRGRRWVILGARARPAALAHELGHHFGLGHAGGGWNLMARGPANLHFRPPRGERPPAARALTPYQVRRLRAGVCAFLSAAASR